MVDNSLRWADDTMRCKRRLFPKLLWNAIVLAPCHSGVRLYRVVIPESRRNWRNRLERQELANLQTWLYRVNLRGRSGVSYRPSAYQWAVQCSLEGLNGYEYTVFIQEFMDGILIYNTCYKTCLRSILNQVMARVAAYSLADSRAKPRRSKGDDYRFVDW